MSPDLSSEIWKPIPGLSGYEASSLGRIRSYWRCAKGKGRGAKEICEIAQIMRLSSISSGHFHLVLGQGTDRKMRMVHSIILETFVGPRPPGKICCHNDGNPQNNKPNNLRWDTHKSNSQDMLKHGRHNPRRGALQKNARLNDCVVAEIRATEGVISQAEWAERLGVSRASIYKVRRAKSWAHV